MKIKFFIVLVYALAGLFISAISAFMTYLIIGVPIGWYMFFKILLTVVFTLPLIGLISYILGSYLSKKFYSIKKNLEQIKNENFNLPREDNFLYELNEINETICYLSSKLDTLITSLKKKNRDLSNMLVSLAHDIKTPIAVINGYIEEIEDGMIVKDDLPKALYQMKEEINFITEITDDMIEYINSIKYKKEQQQIKLYDFVEDEIYLILPMKHNIKFINEVDRDFVISFNKTDLKKVLLNLLINGIKYTKQGYVKIYNKGDQIYIENSGNKIQDEYKEKIFEPFFSIDKSKNRQNSGFGLGLSIAKNLSYNNKFDLNLYTSNDEKTIFYLKEV